MAYFSHAGQPLHTPRAAWSTACLAVVATTTLMPVAATAGPRPAAAQKPDTVPCETAEPAACGSNVPGATWFLTVGANALDMAPGGSATQRQPTAGYLADLQPALRPPVQQTGPQRIAWGLLTLDLEDNVMATYPSAPVAAADAAAVVPHLAAAATTASATTAAAPHAELPHGRMAGTASLAGLAFILASRRIVTGGLLRRLMRIPHRAGRRLNGMLIGVRRVVTVEEIDPATTVTIATLEQRGWSPEAMRALLGRPDYAVVDPQGLREPLILLSRVRVERIEQTGRYQRYLRRSEQRQEVARRQIRKWVELQEMSDPVATKDLAFAQEAAR